MVTEDEPQDGRTQVNSWPCIISQDPFSQIIYYMPIGLTHTATCASIMGVSGHSAPPMESKMKERTAKTLTVGSRLCWDHNAKDGGTVIEVGYNACKVKWDDPSNGEISLLHFIEMANIGLLPRNEQHAPGDVTNLGRGELGI